MLVADSRIQEAQLTFMCKSFKESLLFETSQYGIRGPLNVTGWSTLDPKMVYCGNLKTNQIKNQTCFSPCILCLP